MANLSSGHKNSKQSLETHERKKNSQLGSEILSLFSQELNKVTKKKNTVSVQTEKHYHPN